MKALTLSLFLINSAEATKLRKEETKKSKGKIEIDLTHTHFEGENKLKATSLSEIHRKSLMQMQPNFGVHSLIQKDKESIDMINLMNMGYEGEFWFGKPSQKMQVIFDTGSAWAWLFSEEC